MGSTSDPTTYWFRWVGLGCLVVRQHGLVWGLVGVGLVQLATQHTDFVGLGKVWLG